MIALGILLVAAAYISLAFFLAWLVARAFQSQRAKAASWSLTLLAFALIPTWDIVPARIYFSHLCDNQGGIEVYRQVDGVDGFFGPDLGAGSALHFLKAIGYAYVEGKELNALVRFTLTTQGRVDKTKISEPAAFYTFDRKEDRMPFNIIKYQEVIATRNTGEVIAAKTNFYRGGNWLQRRSSPLLGGGEYCKGDTLSSSAFLATALSPK